MNIKPFDIDRYYVNDYLVDLSEFEGNGWCSCRDFQYRHQPKLQKAEDCGIKPPTSRCKHILLLMTHLNPTIECVQNTKEGNDSLAQETGSLNDSHEEISRRFISGPMLFNYRGRWYDVHNKVYPEYDNIVPTR